MSILKHMQNNNWKQIFDDLYNRVSELEQKVKVLEEENISTTNELYQIENSLDARIDIIAEHCKINTNV